MAKKKGKGRGWFGDSTGHSRVGKIGGSQRKVQMEERGET
jgi:hypothetical protein